MTKKDIDDLAGEGVYYNSFDHLSAGLHRMLTRGHQFRIASSDILRNVDGNQDETFRYRCLVFHCVHFGKARKRGKGARQSTHLATGCQAFIRVNYNYIYKTLEVSKSILTHKGHKLSNQPVGRSAICITNRVHSELDNKLEQPLRTNISKRRSTRVFPSKRMTPEEQIREQSQYVDFLLAKQRQNYVHYAKQRADMGLPPYSYIPPPLNHTTLVDYYRLENKPKEEEPEEVEYEYMEAANDSCDSNDESDESAKMANMEEDASEDDDDEDNYERMKEDYALSSDLNAKKLFAESQIKQEVVSSEGSSVEPDVVTHSSPEEDYDSDMELDITN